MLQFFCYPNKKMKMLIAGKKKKSFLSRVLNWGILKSESSEEIIMAPIFTDESADAPVEEEGKLMSIFCVIQSTSFAKEGSVWLSSGGCVNVCKNTDTVLELKKKFAAKGTMIDPSDLMIVSRKKELDDSILISSVLNHGDSVFVKFY